MLSPTAEEEAPSAAISSIKINFQMTAQEASWLAQIRAHPRFRPSQQGHDTDWDLLRWAHAYKGDLDTAVAKYRRHLRIRQILRLDDIETMGGFAIRISSFMLNRFRLMERILYAVRSSELQTGRRESAVLVLDLEGISFHTSLIGFISGPYRIMWGTLVEQYPSLLSAIVVINCPASVSVLWAACASFLGDDYRQWVHLLGRDWRQRLPADLLPLDALPVGFEYGGCREIVPHEPQCCQIAPLDIHKEELAELETLSIAAGEFLIRTYFLRAGERLQFVLSHEQAITMNILYSAQKRLVGPEQFALIGEFGDLLEQEGLEEAFAGCERPGMPSIDAWPWHVPKDGLYHMALGNEKAWLLPVTVRFQLFQLQPNGQRVKAQAIPVEHLRAQG